MSLSSREDISPKSFHDLIEVIECQERTRGALDQYEEDVAVYGRKLAPLIFQKLSQQIDQDLLFTPETDLVMPSIREATNRVLCAAIPEIKLDHISSWMLDIVSREVHSYITQHRPKNR